MPISEPRNETIATTLISVLQRQGYSRIRSARVEGLEKPSPVIWPEQGTKHYPDVSAYKDGVEYLFEIETEETITDSEGPLKLLSAYAEQNSDRLCVVVPEDLEDEAREVLNRLHIDNATVLTV